MNLGTEFWIKAANLALSRSSGIPRRMHIKIIVHEAEEGGFWAEAPALPGCASQGDSLDELLANMREAIEGCLSIDVPARDAGSDERVLEIVV